MWPEGHNSQAPAAVRCFSQSCGEAGDQCRAQNPSPWHTVGAPRVFVEGGKGEGRRREKESSVRSPASPLAAVAQLVGVLSHN